MNKIALFAISLISMLMYYSMAQATNIPNTDDPKTFLGPTARVGFTNTLNNYTAYNIAGEAGIKNFRLGGTLGWKLAENQRFKVSAEYLWQKITYAFFSGNSDQWVQQGALGAAYQYEFADYSYRPQFDLSAYYSHAPSKTLSTVTGTFNAAGAMTPFTDVRRIAGSNGAGISPGLAFMPWQGGRLSAAINYDSVHYDNKYVSNEDASGLGGTVGLNQALTDDLGLGLSAAVRRPFNNYAANLSWANVPYFGRWTLGLFGDYTVGKNTLPDTYNVGISADYFLDQRCGEAVPANFKGERNLKGEVAPVIRPISDGLLAWTADPAVYMPQVLAIVDERVTTGCEGPPPTVLSAPTISTIGPDPGTTTIDIASHFSGSNLTFSVSPTSDGSFYQDTFSITPQGILTITVPEIQPGARTTTLTVTATNGCGTTPTSFPVNIDIVG